MEKRNAWNVSNWQEWATNCLVSIVFAWMVYKLASILLNFKQHELRVARRGLHLEDAEGEEGEKAGSQAPVSGNREDVSESGNQATSGKEDKEVESKSAKVASGAQDEQAHSQEPSSVVGKPSAVPHDSDDDWEAGDGDELAIDDEVAELFEAAASYIASGAMAGKQLPKEKQFLLYGLYKQATVGPCQGPRPSSFAVAARAKWDAWASQQALSQEEGMKRYIGLLSSMDPDWSRDLSIQEGNSKGESSGQRQGGGPVFSVPVHKEGEAGDSRELSGLLACASSGDEEGLLELLQAGASLQETDEEGRSALHWAVDRGHLAVVEALLKRGAELDSKDAEGQTPLHYACVCEHKDIAAYLLKHGANPQAKDKEGDTPETLKPTSWKWKT